MEQEMYHYHAAWMAFGESQGRCCVTLDHPATAEERMTRDYRIMSGPYNTPKEALKGKHATDSNE